MNLFWIWALYKSVYQYWYVPLLLLVVFFIIITSKNNFSSFSMPKEEVTSAENKLIPSDYFYAQRAFPYNKIDKEAYKKAIAYRDRKKKEINYRQNNAWIFAGPTNIGGRITDIEMFEDRLNIIYVGSASGGIFRSNDRGENWTPVFDDAASLSIGDIAIGKSDRTIYVGTGEANAGGGSLTYDGVGVYKSTNYGDTWEWKGLADVGSIGKLVINPTNSNEVFVAAMGQLFNNNEERGVYRSKDGGDSWEQVLFVSDSTGAIDLLIHPENPSILYAAMWERIRRPNIRQYGGASSGIYKSENGGDTWKELTNGLPLNASEKGRIGLAISNSNPDIVMAVYAQSNGFLQGVYKSINGGEKWSLEGMFESTSYMWWFSTLFIDPKNSAKVFAPALDLYRSNNGGQTFSNVSDNMHVDQHALFIHPLNTDFILAGNDGGVYLSANGGTKWTKKNTLPITQFYTCEIDYSVPQRLYGGTQDNGTNRTLGGAVNNWQNILWGDGFRVLVDPSNNLFIYGESQRGNFYRSIDGGQTFEYAMNGIENNSRRNWNSPFTFDPNQSRTLFFGTEKINKSINRARDWQVISPDLTNGDGGGNLTFGTITTIDVSSINSSIIYAGTDDGNVWNTLDGGTVWTHLSHDLPKRWVTEVATDPLNLSMAYVIYSGYRFGEAIGHIYKTTDNGTTWEDISGNLPDIPLNALIVHPENNQELFLASDIGVFQSQDGGINWDFLDVPLPNIPVTDLDFHLPTNTLLAATYGRGMYKYILPMTTSVSTFPISNIKTTIFPNPASDILNIEFELKNSNTISMYLTDIEQRIVKFIAKKDIIKGSYQWTMNVGDLASGNYFLVIKTDLKQKAVLVQLVD